MRLRRRVLPAAALAVAALAAAHAPPPAPVANPPPGAFAPPAPGSYELPPIPLTARGTVLDESGHAHELARVTHGRITLLGLVYTHCTDPDGCPRATWAFSRVRSMLREDRALEERVRLASLSFDPRHDTPAVMADYAAQVRGREPGAEWRFLTTRSPNAAATVLDALDQDVTRLSGSADAFQHTVKVYLFDPGGRVREIYSSAYLVPEMILNDMRTLALEQPAPQSAASASGGQLQKRLRSP
jgi:cytochrome oxidase Cu insertion factor (SCO1/SenC/PrrC family)